MAQPASRDVSEARRASKTSLLLSGCAVRGGETEGIFPPRTCGVLELQQCAQCTPLKLTNSLHLEIWHPKRKLIFHPSFFRGYVTFRDRKCNFFHLQMLPPLSPWPFCKDCHFLLVWKIRNDSNLSLSRMVDSYMYFQFWKDFVKSPKVGNTSPGVFNVLQIQPVFCGKTCTDYYTLVNYIAMEYRHF